MSRYIEATEQLVTEIMVRDITRSTEFCRRLSCALLRDSGGFVELTWEEHGPFLDERPPHPQRRLGHAACTATVLACEHPGDGAQSRRLLAAGARNRRTGRCAHFGSVVMDCAVLPLLTPPAWASASPVPWITGSSRLSHAPGVTMCHRKVWAARWQLSRRRFGWGIAS